MTAQTEEVDHQEGTETTADTGDTQEVAPDHPDGVEAEDARILAHLAQTPLHAGTAPDNPPLATKPESADREVET